MEEVRLSTLKPGMKDLCCQVMVLDIGACLYDLDTHSLAQQGPKLHSEKGKLCVIYMSLTIQPV